MKPFVQALAARCAGRTACGVLVGLVSIGLYVATLAPGLTWAHDSGDGGELAAAAATLGIAHPPGYPTYVLLAHPWTHLPIGEIATRTNLFSACCAAIACAILAVKTMDVTGRWAVGLGAGLALAVSPLFWAQATVTEVHTLNGLFTVLLLTGVPQGGPRAQEARPANAAGWAVAICLIWGLSLGNHPTALLCAPLVALSLWRLGARWWLAIVGILLGLAVYLYLPLRAASAPPVNWGNPRTVGGLWWMVSGALYRPFLFSLPLRYLPTRLVAWAGLLTRQLGWLGLPLVALGGAALWKRDRPLFGATATTVVLCSGFAIGYDTSDSFLYLVPALVCLVFWLGIGASALLDWIESAAQRAAWASTAVALLFVLLPVTAALDRLPTLNLREDRVAHHFGTTVLERAPESAILLSQEDAHTFALWYFKYALGHRVDVTIVDLGLLSQDWYVAQLSESLGAPVAPLLAQERERRQVGAELDRSICTISSQNVELACLEPHRVGDP